MDIQSRSFIVVPGHPQVYIPLRLDTGWQRLLDAAANSLIWIYARGPLLDFNAPCSYLSILFSDLMYISHVDVTWMSGQPRYPFLHATTFR